MNCKLHKVVLLFIKIQCNCKSYNNTRSFTCRFRNKGINYNSSDATKATLVLEAPGKDFVYVAGSFNNWAPNSTYAMKKNTTGSKFWLELTGLTPGQVYTYQYWVADQTPTTNSPNIVKTADPCSTLVFIAPMMIAEFQHLLIQQCPLIR